MRILIADDHPIVRKGVRSILESRKDLEVCGEATNGEEAVRKSLEVNPELIILDVTMPVLDGFSAARKIKEAMPAVPILMLSMQDGPEMARSSRSVGAQGFVTKAATNEVLLKAVDVLIAGGTFFPATLEHEQVL